MSGSAVQHTDNDLDAGICKYLNGRFSHKTTAKQENASARSSDTTSSTMERNIGILGGVIHYV